MNVAKFRLLYKSTEPPASLIYFRKIDDIMVYQSGINGMIYILYEADTGTYYSIRYLKTSFESLNLDLQKNIDYYIKHKNESHSI